MLHPQASAFINLLAEYKVPPTHTLPAVEARRLYRERRALTQPDPSPVAEVREIPPLSITKAPRMEAAGCGDAWTWTPGTGRPCSSTTTPAAARVTGPTRSASASIATPCRRPRARRPSQAKPCAGLTKACRAPRTKPCSRACWRERFRPSPDARPNSRRR